MSLFLLAALITGALVPIQLAFNAQLGGVTKDPFTAGFLIFLIGTLALATIIVITRPALPTIDDLTTAPRTVWLGGLIATAYIVAIVIVTPKLGVGLTTALIIVGQLCTALALDHIGAFGTPQIDFNLWRLAGAALMIGGVVLIKAN